MQGCCTCCRLHQQQHRLQLQRRQLSRLLHHAQASPAMHCCPCHQQNSWHSSAVPLLLWQHLPGRAQRWEAETPLQRLRKASWTFARAQTMGCCQRCVCCCSCSRAAAVCQEVKVTSSAAARHHQMQQLQQPQHQCNCLWGSQIWPVEILLGWHRG